MSPFISWSLLFFITLPVVKAPEILVQKQPRLARAGDVVLWQRMLSPKRATDHTRLPVYMRLHGERALRLGQTFSAAAKEDTWQLVHLDSAALQQALNFGEGVSLEHAPAHAPQLMRSIPEVRADLAQQGKGLEMARHGRGVLIGIIDTGIDLTHPAFRRSDGKLRVVAFWDQDAVGGPAPVNYGYGKECTLSMLQDDKCNLGDPVGHGTHVAGIAAGSSSPPGVADQADIAVVRSNAFTRIADAMEYLVEVADNRDQPLVINISVGGQYGPHDGRTPLEEYLGNLAGPGRLFVAAAGNDGGDSVHMQTDLTAEPARIEIEGLPPGVDAATDVEFWSAPTALVDIALELWIDSTLLSSVPLASSTSELVSGSINYDGTELVSFMYGLDDYAEHTLMRRGIVLTRNPAVAWPDGAVLAFRLSGQGTVDGWVSQGDYTYGRARFGESRGEGWLSGDGERSITVPATAPKMIAVGSYTIRTQWQAIDGSTQSIGALPYGSLAAYSSQGPTPFPELTGIKPDLCAPGTVVASARASGLAYSYNDISDKLTVMQGTSMAAPHVTGVLALMLEANPTLTPKKAKKLLHASARQDESTGVAPNFAWGYGKLDAQKAVRLTEKSAPGSCSALWVSDLGWLLMGWLWHRKKLAVDRRDC